MEIAQVGETLARVQQGIEEVKIAMEKRADMLSRLESIQGAVAEVQWLKEYEQDTNRFKVAPGKLPLLLSCFSSELL